VVQAAACPCMQVNVPDDSTNTLCTTSGGPTASATGTLGGTSTSTSQNSAAAASGPPGVHVRPWAATMVPGRMPAASDQLSLARLPPQWLRLATGLAAAPLCGSCACSQGPVCHGFRPCPLPGDIIRFCNGKCMHNAMPMPIASCCSDPPLRPGFAAPAGTQNTLTGDGFALSSAG